LLTALIIASVIVQGQDPATQPQTPSGAAIVSKMMGHYADAQTLSGTIKYTLTSGNASVSLDTYVQYQRPGLIYVKQVEATGRNRVWLLVSDGKYFSYDMPDQEPGVGRLVESMAQVRSDKRFVDPKKPQPPPTPFDIGDMYKAAAASLVDRSTVLDLAIGRNEDLKYMRHQIATIRYEGKVDVGDRKLDHIVGDWRGLDVNQVTGTYEMFIAEDGGLVRFVRHENTVPETGGPPLSLHSIWDVNLTVNGAVNPSLFKIVR